MKIRYRIIVVSTLIGVLFGFVDSVIDAAIFHTNTLGAELLFDVSPHEIYMRSYIIVCFLVFGIIVAKLTEKRIEVNEALGESEEKFRSLFESVDDAIFILDLKGNFVDANRTAYERLGYTKDELLSMHISQLDPPDFAFMVPERIAQTMRNGRAVFESAHMRKNGSLMPVEINARIVDFRGKPVLLSVIRDITKRKKAEEEVMASLREKEVLLQEVHHRVKNNMAIISSLLQLQSRNADQEVMDMFRDSQNRINSMALIHERLYQCKDFSKIDVRGYVTELAGNLLESRTSGTNDIKLSVSIDDIRMDMDSLIPCGLIINELVTNSLKHAFGDVEDPEIVIRLRENTPGEVALLFSDNGCGMDLNKQNGRTLGLQIVDVLVRQLEGKKELDTSSGTTFRISFSPGG